MIDRQHRFLASLDGLVNWTGLPDLAMATPRKRTLRWTPILALAIASAGLIRCLVESDANYWSGYAIIMVGFFIATLMPTFGPLNRFNEPIDETQRQLRRDSFLVGLAAVTVAAFAGIWLTIGELAAHAWSTDTAQRELMALAFYMIALFAAVPTLHASWRKRLDTADGT